MPNNTERTYIMIKVTHLTRAEIFVNANDVAFALDSPMASNVDSSAPSSNVSSNVVSSFKP